MYVDDYKYNKNEPSVLYKYNKNEPSVLYKYPTPIVIRID